MLKWLITLAVVLFVLGAAGPLLARLGLGRLPGDARFWHKGRNYYFPVATSVVLSLLITLIFQVLKI